MNQETTCTISEVTGSLCTAAVRPTPEDPLPVVYTALGEICAMYFINCDLATPGSPAWLTSIFSHVYYLLQYFEHRQTKEVCYLLASLPFLLLMSMVYGPTKSVQVRRHTVVQMIVDSERKVAVLPES